MKTSELQGAALDWAVAKCEGMLDVIHDTTSEELWYYDREAGCDKHFWPSTDWAQAGPIIEREGISIDQRDNWSLVLACIDAPMEHEENEIWVNGPTPLIAAMRCYVSSKLGDEIEIPEQLMEGENK